MISIEKAKRLKELNLEWSPKLGDWYKVDYQPTPTLFTVDTLRLDDKEIECVVENVKENTWLPNLTQMLDEIKKYNWTYALYSENEIEIETRIENIAIIDRHKNYEGNIIDDIVADALIWILQCKKYYIQYYEKLTYTICRHKS